MSWWINKDLPRNMAILECGCQKTSKWSKKNKREMMEWNWQAQRASASFVQFASWIWSSKIARGVNVQYLPRNGLAPCPGSVTVFPSKNSFQIHFLELGWVNKWSSCLLLKKKYYNVQMSAGVIFLSVLHPKQGVLLLRKKALHNA